MARERNEAVERMEMAEAEPEAAPVRGMGGSPTRNAKGVPQRKTASPQGPRPRGRGRKGTVSDLLSVFGAPGVGRVTVQGDIE